MIKMSTRRFARVPVAARARALLDGRFCDDVRDMSEKGMGLKTAYPLDIGTEVKFTIDLPGEKEPVEVTGRIKWVNERGMGLEFHDAEFRLVAFIESQRKALERI